jgi:hypothetical protein
MGKFFNKYEEHKTMAAKIRSGEFIPLKIIASKIYNEQNKPTVTVNSSPDYVHDWIKMNS